MNAATEDVLKKALELEEKERAQLAVLLIESLGDEPSEEVEAAWVAEIERRAAELESGSVEGIPWEEVREKLLRSGGGT
jgi:putative addiction module component (TIGR02574 family)